MAVSPRNSLIAGLAAAMILGGKIVSLFVLT
jgi:hypothetical protein